MTPLMTWLVPAAGTERDRLAATIDRLAAEHDAPRFQPHVTMAATFDSAEDMAVHALASLVVDMPPVEVTFASVGHEQTFFRSLYLCAEPSARLLALHEATVRAWALDPSPYVPHLSLLYSNITEEHKRPIIDNIGISLPLTVRFDAVELWAQDPRGVTKWYRVAQTILHRGREDYRR